MSLIYSGLLVRSIPLHGYIKFCLPCLLMYLGCFKFGLARNKFAVNICEQVLTEACFYFCWVNI